MIKRTFGDSNKQSSKALRIRIAQLTKYLLEDSSQYKISPNRWHEHQNEPTGLPGIETPTKVLT
jgi:hypothetical protein